MDSFVCQGRRRERGRPSGGGGGASDGMGVERLDVYPLVVRCLAPSSPLAERLGRSRGLNCFMLLMDRMSEVPSSDFTLPHPTDLLIIFVD